MIKIVFFLGSDDDQRVSKLSFLGDTREYHMCQIANESIYTLSQKAISKLLINQE